MFSLRKLPLWAVAFFLAAGCAHPAGGLGDSLAARIHPPEPVEPPAAAPVRLGAAVAGDPQAPRAEADGSQPSGQALPPPPSAAVLETDRTVCGPLTLPDAIALAFRLQPKLRVYLENVEQARGRADIAFAPFLPTVVGAYSAGGFNLNAGGEVGGFNFLPPGGVIPFGLQIETNYTVAELKLQWLVCDFGRRLGRHRQAELGVAITRLQTDRAYQTVANEVAVAYYEILRTQALRRAAQESVRRAEEDLGVARKLKKQGVIEQEKVLRAEVQVAQTQKLLDAAEAAAGIAVAALNLAIGLNVSAPTAVVNIEDIPPIPPSLAECLATAAGQRRELDVARRAIQVGLEGEGVARADFAPRVVAEGLLFDFQQAVPRGRLDLALGFIKLEWGLFEGGKRVAELHIADSKTRAAVAEAESVADTISFQVNEAYRKLVAARKGIDRARPAVEQAQESYRLLRARAAQEDATPSEVIDAETALARAQQDSLNSTCDYLPAVARLEYEVGVARRPGQPLSHGR
jgi:outer membrane protein TolC